MENISQQNREQIIKLQGKIDLLNQEITLYAYKLVFNHPISNEEIQLTAPEPKTWEQFKV